MEKIKLLLKNFWAKACGLFSDFPNKFSNWSVKALTKLKTIWKELWHFIRYEMVPIIKDFCKKGTDKVNANTKKDDEVHR